MDIFYRFSVFFFLILESYTEQLYLTLPSSPGILGIKISQPTTNCNWNDFCRFVTNNVPSIKSLEQDDNGKVIKINKKYVLIGFQHESEAYNNEHRAKCLLFSGHLLPVQQIS